MHTHTMTHSTQQHTHGHTQQHSCTKYTCTQQHGEPQRYTGIDLYKNKQKNPTDTFARTTTEMINKDTKQRGGVHWRLLFGGVSSEVVLGGWWIGVAGSGQTRSRTSTRQYSLILSNKYFCRSRESPGGVMEGGLSTCDGVHTPRNSVRCSSTAVVVFLRKTTPGWSRSKRK